MVICLERGADLHMAQLMPLPLTVTCSSKIQIGSTFLVPAYPGSPGKRAVKSVCFFFSETLTSRGPCQNLAVCLGFDGLILLNTSRHVASLRAGLTLIIYWVGLACVHLKLNSAIVADATPICYLCGVARVQPSTSDGPTCNIP